MSSSNTQQDVIRILHEDWGLSRQTARKYGTRLAKDPALLNAFHRWSADHTTIPQGDVAGYQLSQVVQGHQLIPLHAFFLLTEKNPDAIMEARENGDIGPYPWVPERKVRIYQAEHALAIVGMKVTSANYIDVQFGEVAPVLELVQPDVQRLAAAIHVATAHTLDQFVAHGHQDAQLLPALEMSDVARNAQTRWEIQWGAYDGETSYVNIYAEPHATPGTDEGGMRRMSRAINDSRFLHPPVSFVMLADWVVHAEKTLRNLSSPALTSTKT